MSKVAFYSKRPKTFNYTIAYELKMLENDDDYKPEMEFPPLEKSKPFIDYNIQKGVVCILCAKTNINEYIPTLRLF